MAIDAFTLIAQVVNFLVLLFLLRAFLFRPVQRVMAERERRIAEEHERAERARAAAETEAQALREAREAFALERRERLTELDRELERTARERFEQVHVEAGEARAAWRSELERAGRDAADALRRRAPALLADALRRGWRELADEALEDRAVSTFMQRLTTLDAATRQALTRAAASGPVALATAFDTTPQQRQALSQAVTGLLGAGVAPAFERDPSLVAGVALHAGDLRLGWSVDDHVTGLAQAWDAATEAAWRHGGSPPRRDSDGPGADGNA